MMTIKYISSQNIFKNNNKKEKKEKKEERKREIIKKIIKKLRMDNMWMDDKYLYIKNSKSKFYPEYKDVNRKERIYNQVYPVLYDNIKNSYPMTIREGFKNLKSENYVYYIIMIIVLIVIIMKN
jgi:hypothetical protein